MILGVSVAAYLHGSNNTGWRPRLLADTSKLESIPKQFSMF